MVKMESAVDRHVFYISDGTAITAEVLGHAVMSQFPVAISSVTLPFVEKISRARAVKEQIDSSLKLRTSCCCFPMRRISARSSKVDLVATSERDSSVGVPASSTALVVAEETCFV